MKILLFGATGMAGAAVLEGCLAAKSVDEVRVIVRRPLTQRDPKLKVYIHDDFVNFAKVADAFTGVDACLYCLGISSTQVNEAEYKRISYDMPLAAAKFLKERSPNAVLHYITGQGTNEKGRMNWARVKGATERELMHLYGGVAWRPAIIHAKPSDHSPKAYKLFLPVARLFKPFRSFYIEGADLSHAMLQATKEGYRSRIVENREARDLAERAAV